MIFRFDGFQQDAFGGLMPLFSEVVLTPYKDLKFATIVDVGTTLSGRSLNDRGFLIPFYDTLKHVPKGGLLEIKERSNVRIKN